MLRYTETDFEDHIEQRLHRSGYRVLQSYHHDDVIDEILLGFVNSKLELYTKLSKSSNPQVNTDLKRQLYQAYLEQSPANLDST